MFQNVGYLPASNQEGPVTSLGQSMWNFLTQSGIGRSYAPSTSVINFKMRHPHCVFSNEVKDKRMSKHN